MATPPDRPEPQGKAQQGLIDTAIVLLISVALTIFAFWLGTTFAGAAVLVQLPDFITNPFKAIWTSVATGGSGIGLAIVRALSRANLPKPNYLKQILATTGLISLVVFLVGYLSRPTGPTFAFPNDVTFVDPEAETTSPQDFTLAPNPGMGGPVSFSLTGRYEMQKGHLLRKVCATRRCEATFW
jgi:ABC-type antimicrobial peptide transport system permease subunit